MNKLTDTNEKMTVQAALGLAEETFEREYASDGVGVVIPGVVAVDEQGQKLSRSALLPEFPDVLPPDLLYAHAAEQTFQPAPEVDRAAVAYAAVRIDADWPRIIAWHRRKLDLTCEAKPRFVGDALTNWTENWGTGFPAAAPDGPRDGLIEIEYPSEGVSAAGFILVVRERIRACATP